MSALVKHIQNVVCFSLLVLIIPSLANCALTSEVNDTRMTQAELHKSHIPITCGCRSKNGLYYFGTLTGVLLSLDVNKSTAEVLAAKMDSAAIAIAWSDESLIVNTHSKVTAFDTATWTSKWTHSYESANGRDRMTGLRDTKLLFMNDSNTTTSCRDSTTGRVIFSFDQSNSVGALPKRHAAINSIAAAPSGKRLAIALSTGISIVDTESQREVLFLPVDDFDVCKVVFCPKSQLLYVAGDSITIWNVETGEKLGESVDAKDAIAVSISDDGERIAVATGTTTNKPSRLVVMTNKLKTVAREDAHIGKISHVSFLPGSHDIITAGVDGCVKLWKLQ